MYSVCVSECAHLKFVYFLCMRMSVGRKWLLTGDGMFISVSSSCVSLNAVCVCVSAWKGAHTDAFQSDSVGVLHSLWVMISLSTYFSFIWNSHLFLFLQKCHIYIPFICVPSYHQTGEVCSLYRRMRVNKWQECNLLVAPKLWLKIPSKFVPVCVCICVYMCVCVYKHWIKYVVFTYERIRHRLVGLSLPYIYLCICMHLSTTSPSTVCVTHIREEPHLWVLFPHSQSIYMYIQ